MFASPKIIGIAIGLIAAAMVFLADHPRHAPPDPGAMISECDGAIQSIVIQYVAGADFTTPIYRQFLCALPKDVRVYVVCPAEVDFAELKNALGATGQKLMPIFVHHPMTPWSRDRWIALRGDNSITTTLASPMTEATGDLWPQRTGDSQMAADLARSLGPAVRCRSAGLFLDGGDLLADSRCVFATPAVLHRNIQHTAATRQELEKSIEKLAGRQVIFLDDAPDHHVGMYMMAAGEGRVVVGDPSLAKPLIEPIDLPGGADFSEVTQRKFDSVAKAAAGAGYQVTRIPCVSAGDGKTYLTYLNGIIDQRDGHRTIYMPTFRGQDQLNAAATRTWEKLDYRVVPIDVTSSFRLFGTLHCLVNVMHRSRPVAQFASDSTIR